MESEKQNYRNQLRRREKKKYRKFKDQQRTNIEQDAPSGGRGKRNPKSRNENPIKGEPFNKTQ